MLCVELVKNHCSPGLLTCRSHGPRCTRTLVGCLDLVCITMFVCISYVQVQTSISGSSPLNGIMKAPDVNSQRLLPALISVSSLGQTGRRQGGTGQRGGGGVNRIWEGTSSYTTVALRTCCRFILCGSICLRVTGENLGSTNVPR